MQLGRQLRCFDVFLFYYILAGIFIVLLYYNRRLWAVQHCHDGEVIARSSQESVQYSCRSVQVCLDSRSRSILTDLVPLLSSSCHLHPFPLYTSAFKKTFATSWRLIHGLTLLGCCGHRLSAFGKRQRSNTPQSSVLCTNWGGREYEDAVSHRLIMGCSLLVASFGFLFTCSVQYGN